MTSAAARWAELESDRQSYLDTAIDCSQLTIPSLIPESDRNTGGSRTNEANPSRKLYQSLGSRGLSNVAAKLLIALFPPSQPNFRLMIDRDEIERQAQERGETVEQVASKADLYLAQAEHKILMKMDKMKLRASLFEAMKHLAAGGTGLLYVTAAGIRFFGLRSIVGERDADDNVQEIVIREQLGANNLPKPAQRILNKKGANGDTDTKAVHYLYTHVIYNPQLGNKAVQWYQEYDGRRLPGSAGFSAMDKSPWIPLRLNKVSGSFYGTGLVEELLGDLVSYNQLSKAITQAGLGAAKTIFLVNPNGVTRVDALNRAENFDFVSGDAKDVEALEVGKAADYQTAFSVMQAIERRLNFSFLITQAIQRDAERVTAEELRIMVNMLEESFGGIYTLLADELQLPLIRRVVHMMSVANELPPMPPGVVDPQITAGADALGRGSDKQRLTQFFAFIQAAYGPQAALQYTEPAEAIRRAAAAEGVVAKDLVLTPEQITKKQNAQQQVQLAGTLADKATNVVPPPPTPAGSPAAPGGAGPGAPVGIPG